MAEPLNLRRYSLGNFYDTIPSFDGQPYKDAVTFSFNDFNDFIMRKPARAIRLNSTLSGNPDLISYLEYGTEEYWWVICFANKIVDPFTELYTGRVLALPQLSDIEDYYQQKRETAIRTTTVILN